MFANKVLALAAVVILAGSSAVFAQAKRTDQRAVTSARQFDARAAFAQSPRIVGNGIVGNTVIREGRVIGRDRDPNVRLQVYRDWQSYY